MTLKHTFYIPPDCTSGETVIFPEQEAHHASRVLRLQAGDRVSAVDGCGRRMRLRLGEVSRKRVTASIEEAHLQRPALANQVVVAAALLKNAGRFETMLEKVAEIGATRVVPLTTARTEKASLRARRCRTILTSAMKQSGSAFLTHMEGTVALREFVVGGNREKEVRLVCHEGVDPSMTLASALASAPTSGVGRTVVLLIGPEGGFTDSEIEFASASGFQPVSLGRARLRAETAAIVAVAGIAHSQRQN
jgi:16S rRNA (uracil1498-N3)-methyltransferase